MFFIRSFYNLISNIIKNLYTQKLKNMKTHPTTEKLKNLIFIANLKSDGFTLIATAVNLNF